jgi:hypothetical protein
VTPLRELFPEGDFRFHLTLRRGDAREFFRPRDASGRVLPERRHWLDAAPDRYCGCTATGEPLVDEFHGLCVAWELLDAARASLEPEDRGMRLRSLGSCLEPDVLFLSRHESGRFVLRAGVLCFPTGWALAEKIGHDLGSIHGVVPGLNPALGPSIDLFLEKLKPGFAFFRDNWGIAASDELNAHPVRRLPAPAPPATLDRLWLRVEHQALLALPSSAGIVFAIRIALHRLDDVASDPIVAASLARALASMPASLAAYKRVNTVRVGLVRQLSALS